MGKMEELYAKVAGDSALQKKFAEILKGAAEEQEAAKEKLTAFAKEAGYEVSIEEAQEYFKALIEQKEDALSGAELDMVAGGKQEPDGTGSIVFMGQRLCQDDCISLVVDPTGCVY